MLTQTIHSSLPFDIWVEVAHNCDRESYQSVTSLSQTCTRLSALFKQYLAWHKITAVMGRTNLSSELNGCRSHLNVNHFHGIVTGTYAYWEYATVCIMGRIIAREVRVRGTRCSLTLCFPGCTVYMVKSKRRRFLIDIYTDTTCFPVRYRGGVYRLLGESQTVETNHWQNKMTNLANLCILEWRRPFVVNIGALNHNKIG